MLGKNFILKIGIVLAILGVMITPAHAQTLGQPIYRLFNLTTGVPSGPNINEIGTGVNLHSFSWWVTGSLATCQVKLEKSSTGAAGTWSDLIAAQACTSNGGPTTVTSGVANYVRVTASTITGTGTLNALYTGALSSSSSTATIVGTVDVACVTGCDTADTDDGTVAAAQTTGISIAENYVFDGTNWKRMTAKTNNAAIPGATNFGVLGCIANAADPSLTETFQVGCSVNLAGYIRAVLQAETSKVIGTVRMTGTSGETISPVTDPCDGVLPSKFNVHIATTTPTLLIPATSAKKNYICSLIIKVAGTGEIINVQEGTNGGADCDTAVVAIIGSTTEANGIPLSANEGFVYNRTVPGTGTNVQTCIATSGSNAVTVFGTYVQQ